MDALPWRRAAATWRRGIAGGLALLAALPALAGSSPDLPGDAARAPVILRESVESAQAPTVGAGGRLPEQRRAAQTEAPPLAATMATGAVLGAVSGLLLSVRNRRRLRRRGLDAEARCRQLEREIGERRRAEASLQASLAALDERVAERTAELARTAGSLKASEARYRNLVDNLGDAYAVFDMEGRILECNEAFCSLLGCGAARLRAMRDRELTPPQWHAMDAEFVHGELLKHDACASYEKEYLREDGTVVPVEWRPHLVRDEGGNPVGSWAIVRDISERRAEMGRLDELRREEQVILDNVSVGVMYLKHRRLVWGNRQFGRIMGCEVGDLIGESTRHFYASGSDAEYAAIGEVGAAVLARGERFEREVEGRRRTGEPFWVRLSALAIDTADPMAGVIVCIEDITERRRAADDLRRASAAAEAASHAKSAFLASMSHEIRTPLNAILGMAALIGRSGVTPAQDQRLEEIQRAGRHLLAILNDVLDLSRIDAGRLQLAESAFDLEAVVGEAADMAWGAVNDKKLSLRVKVQHPDSMFVGDPVRLRQMLLNYLNNAVKFTSAGSVTVRTAVVASGDDSVLMRFEVADTGAGIAPGVLPQLFVPFEQGSHALAGKRRGTGLGLSITRRLAEAMGGSAGATSEPGKGSTFWFTARLGRGPRALSPVPVPADRAAAHAKEAECRRIAPGKHVLLVEDDPINREVAASLLADVGLAVDCAEDGAAAVRAAAAHDFDLILMDLQLPDLDGLEATRRIRRSPNGATVPIVALTANAFSDVNEACLAAGMNDFLTKPIEPEKLFAAIVARVRPGAAMPDSG